MSVTGGGQNLGTATFYIVGDASGAQNAATQANAALASMAGNVQKNLFGINQLGIAFSVLPSAVGAGMGLAIKSTIELQDAFFKLGVATGETGAAQDALQDKLLALGRVIPVATTELIGLAAAGAQLGVANEDLAQFSETMAIFVAATDAGQQGVTDLAKVMNIFQTPNSEIESLTNTVIELGRNTASTEGEILNITRRFAPAAAAAGVTAKEALALGTALTSLGPRAEAGGTALNGIFAKMARGVAGTEDTLKSFANVTHMSVNEFSTLFQTDATQAVAKFVTALGQMNEIDSIRVLDDLGIKEKRLVQSLQALASGTRDVGSSQRDLNQILTDTLGKYSDSNVVQDALAAKAKTLGGQITILRNIFQQFGATLGSMAAGPLGTFIRVAGDILNGFLLLPAPIRIATVAFFAIITAISAVGAAIFLIGTRVILAKAALAQLSATGTQTSGALGSLTTSMYANATAAQAEAAALAELNAVSKAFFGGMSAMTGATPIMAKNLGQLGVSAVQVAGAEETAAASTGVLSGALGTLGAVLPYIGIALAAVAIGSAILGNHQRKQAEAAKKAQEPNQQLVNIMRQQKVSIGAQSDALLQSLPAFQNVRVLAQQLGIDLQTLTNIINGTITSGPQFDDFRKKIEHADGATKKNITVMAQLTKMYAASAGKAGVAKRAVGGFGDAESAAAEATAKANKALQKQHDLMDGIAQAHIDLISAERAQEDAEAALLKAQQDYADVLAEVGDTAEQLRDAELKLLSAQNDQSQAIQKLSDLERELGTVRQEEAQKAHDAELDLADARNEVLDNAQKVKDIEEDLAKLREGPSVNDLTKATDKLRDAQLKLLASTRTVEDAEFQLQKLREDGASNRDIAEAEQAVSEAQLAVSKSTTDIADAQSDLNDLRDGTKRQEKIADKERELQDAYRDSERSIEDVEKKEKDLAKLRDDIAKDRAYKDKQAEIIDAQIKVQAAIDDTGDAERDLDKLRQGLPNDKILAAQQTLEDAIYNVADANVEVLKQTTLAEGGMWDAGKAAHALADELSRMIGFAPTATSVKDLQDFINTLRNAPNVPAAPVDNGDSGSAGGGGGVDPMENPAGDGEEAGKSWADGFSDAIGSFDFKEAAKKILTSIGHFLSDSQNYKDIAKGLGTGIGFALGLTFKALIGLPFIELPKLGLRIVKGIVSGMSWEGIKKWFSDLPVNITTWTLTAGTWLGGVGGAIIDGLLTGLDAVYPGVRKWFEDLPHNIVRIVKNILGINSPSTVFADIGRDILRGLLQGLGNIIGDVTTFFVTLPRNILSWVGGIGGTLVQSGIDLIYGLLHGAYDFLHNDVYLFAIGIPGEVVTWVGDMGETLLAAGKAVITGFWNGMKDVWGSAKHGVAGWLSDRAQNIIDLKGPPKKDASLLTNNGQLVMQGFLDGLQNGWRDVEDHLTEVSNSLADSFTTNSSDIGKALIDSIIAGMEDQFSVLEQTLAEVSGMVHDGLSGDYLRGLVDDIDSFRAKFASSDAGVFGISQNIPSGGNTTEVLNLNAITSADPASIMNEYTWTKRVRLRGGSK